MENKTEKKREYVVIRTYSAGVHAGYLVRRIGKEVELADSRRLWYWAGAMTLSEVAVNGVNQAECKFGCVVNKLELTEAIEILYATEKARNSIEGVKIWK